MQYIFYLLNFIRLGIAYSRSYGNSSSRLWRLGRTLKRIENFSSIRINLKLWRLFKKKIEIQFLILIDPSHKNLYSSLPFSQYLYEYCINVEHCCLVFRGLVCIEHIINTTNFCDITHHSSLKKIISNITMNVMVTDI